MVAGDIGTISDRSNMLLSPDVRRLFGMDTGFIATEAAIPLGWSSEIAIRRPLTLRRLIPNCEQRTRNVPTVHPMLRAISSARSPWSTQDLILVIAAGVSFLRCAIHPP